MWDLHIGCISVKNLRNRVDASKISTFISKKARPSWRLNFASCPPQRQERPEVQPGFSLDIYYPVKTPTTICIWRRPEDRTYSYESSGRCSIFRLNFLMFLV